MLQIVLGTRQQAASFSRIDAVRAASKVAAAAQTNLDEYDGRAVEHYQIELSVTTTVVARHQAQTVIDEVLEGEILALSAAVG